MDNLSKNQLYLFRRSRVIVSAITGTINYIFSFTNKKIYHDLETALSLPGVSLMYCALSGIGLISMYFILPETEDRSLEDIEMHFSDNAKKWTDRKITKTETHSETWINIDGKPSHLQHGKEWNFTILDTFLFSKLSTVMLS